MSEETKNLIKFWQEKRYWLNYSDAIMFDLVDDLYITMNELDLAGIPIEVKYKRLDGTNRWRLKCTCQIVSGNDVTDGCYVHDPKLKVS